MNKCKFVSHWWASIPRQTSVQKKNIDLWQRLTRCWRLIDIFASQLTYKHSLIKIKQKYSMYIYSLVKKVYYQSTRSIHVYLSVFARQRTQRRILFFGYTAQLYKRRVQPCRMKRIRMYREKRKRKERVLIVARGRKHTREVYICAYAYVCARVSSAAFVCWFVPVIELDRRHFLHWTGFLIYTQGGPKIINC